MATEDTQNESTFDTDSQNIGSVYAKALLGLADRSGKTDSIMEELDSFASAIQSLPRLRETLESPRVSAAEKARIIDKALAGKASKEFANFVKVVVSRDRAGCFPAIRNAARELVDERTNQVRATMITAEPVGDDVMQSVARRMEQVLGKKVILSPAVDPEIIGGVVVRVGDTVYDGSIRNQLNQVRAAAVSRANQEIRNSLERFATGA